MTVDEKDALLYYIEFHLFTMLQSMEGGATVGELYDLMYNIISDIEITIDTNNNLHKSPKVDGLPKKPS
jgi:hypothetical protein